VNDIELGDLKEALHCIACGSLPLILKSVNGLGFSPSISSISSFMMNFLIGEVTT
jgi:hypothetical protein